MDNKETIVKFLTAMSTQDNRCTAFPIYYVIRDARWVITEEDYVIGDSRIVYVNKQDYEDIITEDEHGKLAEKYDDVSEEDRLNGVCSQEEYRRFCEVCVWQDHGMFLTQTDAEKHLKLNAYHYSEDAHTYVKHAWRAPELEEFLLALFEYFGVEPRKDKGTM